MSIDNKPGYIEGNTNKKLDKEKLASEDIFLEQLLLFPEIKDYYDKYKLNNEDLPEEIELLYMLIYNEIFINNYLLDCHENIVTPELMLVIFENYFVIYSEVLNGLESKINNYKNKEISDVYSRFLKDKKKFLKDKRKDLENIMQQAFKSF